MKYGLVGLPNVGKTTLFNALTRAGAPVANFPFTTIDRHLGVAAVNDPRLEVVARLAGSAQATPTSLEVVDIAGLIKGASRGEGLGNQFLGHIRGVDAVLEVVRCFVDPEVVHVSGAVDPVADMEVVHLELCLADLEALARRREKLAPRLKAQDPKSREEAALLDRLEEALARGIPAGRVGLSPREAETYRDLNLLTAKPRLYVANVAEGGGAPADPLFPAVERRAREEGARAIPLCARLEAELAELDEAERPAFMEAMGLQRSGLDRLVEQGYGLLDLITFFTANQNEARAWTLPRGARALEAAGKIHSDMARGFIAAEVIGVADLARTQSLAAARERGQVRLEGKDYRVQDGDVIQFRFHVAPGS